MRCADSLPHTNSATGDIQPSVDSGETDRPATTADDQSQLSGGDGQLTSVGGETVSSNSCDKLSTDNAESATENIEPHKTGVETGLHETGSETVSPKESGEAVSQTEGGETVSHETGGETACDVLEPTVDGRGTNDVMDETVEDTAHKTDATPTMTTDDSMNKVNDFLALSYTFHPPDGSSFDQPYVDDFWQCRWMRMEAEIRRMLRKSSRLASDVITLDSSDSSDYDELDDDYEDSMASNSPIFVPQKSAAAAAEDDEDDTDGFDEIVLDESSSTAIVVDEDEDDAAEAGDEDDIVCSGESNDDVDNGDSSIVVCDGDSSSPLAVPGSGSTPPPASTSVTAVSYTHLTLPTNREV